VKKDFITPFEDCCNRLLLQHYSVWGRKTVLYKTHVLDVCVACGSCRRIQLYLVKFIDYVQWLQFLSALSSANGWFPFLVASCDIWTFIITFGHNCYMKIVRKGLWTGLWRWLFISNGFVISV